MKQEQGFIKPEIRMAFVLTPWCGDGVDWAYKWYCAICDLLVNMEGAELEHQQYHQKWLSLTKRKREAEKKEERKELGQQIKGLVAEYALAASAPIPRSCDCSNRMAYGHEAHGKLFLDKEHPEAGPQRAFVGDAFSNYTRGCPWTDVAGQYVLLKEFSPNPNMTMVAVAETGTKKKPWKHDGIIEEIRGDPRFLVVKEWVQDMQAGSEALVHRIDDIPARMFLLENGFDPWLVDYTLRGGMDIETLRLMLKARERPAIHVATMIGAVQLPSWVPPMQMQPVMEARNIVTWRSAQVTA